MDIDKIRPMNDWILVKMDPIETMVGSIFVPIGTVNRKATVLAVGPGKEEPSGVRQPVGVEPGDRVVFHRSHGEHLQGKQLVGVLGEDHLLIRPGDVLLVFTEDLQIL
jgi:chaperonin GroES